MSPQDQQEHLAYFEWFKGTFDALADPAFPLIYPAPACRFGIAHLPQQGVQLYYKTHRPRWYPARGLWLPFNDNEPDDLFERTESWALNKHHILLRAGIPADDFRHHVLFTALLDYPPFRRP